ncbi:MAG: P-II family nitrogen regulator [Oscillospiraceae bacterium]|nr:P-II family nitrogen regulator [Oscillospiraceae bacterium]
MKEVMIIIRPKMYYPTKDALDEAGFNSMTIRNVIGRGKNPVHYDSDPDDSPKFRLVAKRMINMYVCDDDVQRLIDVVVKVNETNHAGDGKIFVLPVDTAVRIRTGETGIEAIM